MKLVKNQAKTKQHHEAELLVFENCSISSTALSSKNNFGEITKKVQKKVRLFMWGYIINENKDDAENEK